MNSPLVRNVMGKLVFILITVAKITKSTFNSFNLGVSYTMFKTDSYIRLKQYVIAICRAKLIGYHLF